MDTRPNNPAPSTRPKRPGLEIRPWWGRLLIGRRPLLTVIRLVITVAVVLILTQWCFTPVRITGRSMEPTFRHGRLSLLNRLAYRGHPPQRGDIVGIQLEGRRMILLKRVLGLPGDQVQVRHGQVLINGQPLAEPYARGDEIPSTDGEVTLGPDRYFVIGDNRDVTEYGIVRLTEIKGRLLF